MKLRPTKNRVVIKYIEKENKSSGGIILPTDSKAQPTLGTVVACGKDDKELIQFDVDDIVLFGKFAGTPIKVQDEEFIIMKIDEVMAVIEK